MVIILALVVCLCAEMADVITTDFANWESGS